MKTRILSLLAAAALALPLAAIPSGPVGAHGDTGAAGPRHEIWALDQGEGLDRIHVYDQDLHEVAVIDLADHLAMPHMIDFDSQYRYAFVAGPAGQGVAIIRTADYEVVDVIHTGAGAHMAAVTPDDSAVWVANIGAQTFTEITLDLDNEQFALGRELDVTEDPRFNEEFGSLEPSPGPVCHQYTADGRYAYVTLGPGAGVGGLIVVDVSAEEPVITKAFSRADVQANCGLALSADGKKMYANWGDPGPEGGDEDTGEWYVFDTDDHSLVGGPRDTQGIDAHGVRITPDGTELWQVNRASDNGIVVDTATDEIIDDLEFPGGSKPDILDFSPDGARAYVSLRGPTPRSGAPHAAAGETPGFAVVDVKTRELVKVVQPALGSDDFALSDFHGIGVKAQGVARLAGPGRIETAIATSKRAWPDGAANGAVLARDNDFPDALAGVPLAADIGGPVLLTLTGDLPGDVAAELTRAVAPGSTVYVLGGVQAISEAVVAEVEALGFAVERVSGATRFETAEAVAGLIDDPKVILVATGLDFADAVAAGAAAAARGGVVVLTTPESPHETADRVLAAHDAPHFAVGGPAARAYPAVTPLVGPTRFQTALAVADALFNGPTVAGLARADTFPDALSGGAHVGRDGGPMLLTPSDGLHEDVAGYLCDGDVSWVFGYGGSAALAPPVLQAVSAHLAGAGCA